MEPSAPPQVHPALLAFAEAHGFPRRARRRVRWTKWRWGLVTTTTATIFAYPMIIIAHNLFNPLSPSRLDFGAWMMLVAISLVSYALTKRGEAVSQNEQTAQWEIIHSDIAYFIWKKKKQQFLVQPFVLYLRPFDFDRHQYLLEQMVRYRPAHGVNPDTWFPHRETQFEWALSREFTIPMVAIGDEKISLGIAHVASDTAGWRDLARTLSGASAVIIFVAYSSPGCLWELEQLIIAPRKWRQTIFIVPPAWVYHSDHGDQWRGAFDVANRSGISLPAPKPRELQVHSPLLERTTTLPERGADVGAAIAAMANEVLARSNPALSARAGSGSGTA